MTLLKDLQNKIELKDSSLTEELVLEKLNLVNVTVGKLDKKDFPELKGEVFTISNKSDVIENLIELLGVPKDGTPIRIRTGFMAYDPKNNILFFSKNKYDLPGFIEARSTEWKKKNN